MEYIGLIKPIGLLVSALHSLYKEVQSNKRQCKRLVDRVDGLNELVLETEQMGDDKKVKKVLKNLKTILENAAKLLEKNKSIPSSHLLSRHTFTRIKASLLQVMKGDEFGIMNERLNDAFKVLKVALQVDHNHKVAKLFEAASRREQDEEDRKKDHAELQKMLQHILENQDVFKQMIENLQKTSAIPQIREIKPEELSDRKLFKDTPTSEIYRGKYNKTTVAIKRYKSPMTTDPSQVRKTFNREIQTMERFEAPTILRMFGICVPSENGPNSDYLIVMEYCEKGSLRQVLDTLREELPWGRKARMCLDAAQGLYRLHQTEDKSKVHGNLNSYKFLVDGGYRVKLGGFELSKTATSLGRTENREDQKNISLKYQSPEQLGNVNEPYCKAHEMYSLGIVLWEIATRKKPFDDCSTYKEIHKRVCEDKQVEPLPEDCPEQLRELINACREYDGFHRPTAGELVDKLLMVVEVMEMELMVEQLEVDQMH